MVVVVVVDCCLGCTAHLDASTPHRWSRGRAFMPCIAYGAYAYNTCWFGAVPKSLYGLKASATDATGSAQLSDRHIYASEKQQAVISISISMTVSVPAAC
jgi:hypothetical protein